MGESTDRDDIRKNEKETENNLVTEKEAETERWIDRKIKSIETLYDI